MNPTQQKICLNTILTLVMASGAIAIGYTNYVNAEMKENIEQVLHFLENSQEEIDLNREAINSVQITNAEIKGDIKLILNKLTPEK